MTVSTVSTVSTPGTVTRPSRSSWFPWRHPQHDHPALQAAHDDRTFGERVADHIASFGGSWPFIFIFLGMIVILDSGQHRPAPARHRPAPIRPLSLYRAEPGVVRRCRHPGADHHDEPELRMVMRDGRQSEYVRRPRRLPSEGQTRG